MALITEHGDANVTQAGIFTQNSTASFIIKFFDIDGAPYDPSDITIEILDPADTVVKTITSAIKIEDGVFTTDYKIVIDATIGVWTFRYTFVSHTTTGDETRTIDEAFVVTETSTESAINAQSQRIVLRSYLETLIRQFQRIPAKAEQVIWRGRNRTVADLNWENWNQVAGVKVHRNNNLITSGFEIDYVKGRITFDTALERTDIVDVSYNFRWFSDDDIDHYIQSGVNRLNYYPPVTGYNVGTVEGMWMTTVAYGAAIDAIRTVIMDLMHQEPQIVFGGPDIAQKLMDVLDGQKKNYEEDVKTALDLKKYGNYHNLLAMSITPEFTLPGGRSRWFRMLFK